MTADQRRRRHPRVLSSLGARLVAAFVVVALTAVLVLAGLTLFASRSGVSNLVNDIHDDDAAAAAAAAARAYDAAGGWSGADLSGPLAVAARGQATLTITDADGRLLAAPADEAAAMLASMHGVEIVDVPRGAPVEAPVIVDGVAVGTAGLRFPTSHLPTPEREVRDALSRTVVLGGGLAVAAAVVVAMYVAWRLAAPVTALTTAAASLATGERAVRVDRSDAPGELGTLADAFDRMAAALEREDELRRQLVADVAHEVRTPLTVLRATTEGLVEGVLPADQATLTSLHDEVLRLTRLVGDLDTLAAADAAGLRLETEPLDLADVARSVVQGVAPAAAERRLDVRSELAPAPVVGDERRIHQIVTNLVVNAVRYTTEGGTVTVTSGLDAAEAFVEVCDSGPGLAADELERAFERFYRGSASTGTEGSGIGLAVAAELAAAHGGTVTAANRPAGGACFRFRLPTRSPAD